MLINGGPYYFGDTEGYVKGGQLAIAFASNLISGLFSSGGGSGGGNAEIEAATNGIYGVRSVAYAVFAYLGKWPGDSVILATWVQSLFVIFVLDTFFELSGLRSKSPRILLAIWAILLIATPMAWYAVYATPDVFAGIAILAISLLTVYRDKIHIFRRLILSGLIFFAVMSHLSLIPVLGLLGAFSGFVFLFDIKRLGFFVVAKAFAWVAVPIALGLGTSLAINIVGFDEPSVTGKRYPILLARSIEDGPALWYLREQCAAGSDFAVCEIYPDDTLPTTAGEFLWEPGGIRDIATAEQMERIRVEESQIVQAALSRYPFATLRRSITQTYYQIFSFGLGDHRFEMELVRDPEGELFTTYDKPQQYALRGMIQRVFLAAFMVSLFYFIWILANRAISIQSPLGRMLIMVTGGTFINAAICGSLSAVTNRYQGRVVWVFIACILVIAWARHAHQKAIQKPSISAGDEALT